MTDKKKYQALFEHTITALFIGTPDGRILEANDAACKLFGYTVDEFRKLGRKGIIDPKTPGLKKMLKERDEKGSVTGELIAIRKNGVRFWCQFSSSLIEMNNGEKISSVMLIDISEKKEAELNVKLTGILKALSADISLTFNYSEDLKSALAETLNHIVSLEHVDLAEFWLPDGEQKTLNLIAGKSSSKISKDFYSDREPVMELKKGVGLPGKAWKNKESQFWRNLDKRKTFIRHDAAVRSGLKTGFAFPMYQDCDFFGVLLLANREELKSSPYYLSLFEDISNQIASEIRRKKLEEELVRVFSSAPDIICTAGFDGYFKKVNPAASELLGYSEEELLSQPFVNFLHPDDQQNTVKELSKLQTGNSKTYIENRYITKTGKIIWLSWTAKIYYDEKILYAVAKDITDQKELEIIHDQATRLAMIGSWSLDVKSGEIYWSTITREIHEAEPDFNPKLEEGINFYKPGESREKITEAVKEAIEIGKPWDLELQIITAKGNERWVKAIGQAIHVDGKCVRIFGSFQDIHESKINQEELQSKTAHLDAISKINSALLNYRDWYNALNENLEIIGQAVQADRVYYFENHDDPDSGEGFTSQKMEWCREGIKSQMNNPDLKNFPLSEVSELIEPLIDNRASTALLSELDEDSMIRFVMEKQDIKTILGIPVLTNGQLHGFIGLDNCTEERYWDDEEVAMLKTIASNLATAIERYNFDKELKELFKEKNAILESISDAFFTMDENWNITYFNIEAENMFGKRSDEVIGKSLWDLFPTEAETVLNEQFTEALSKMEAVAFEYYYPPFKTWYDISAYPSEGGISAYFKNINERKEAQRKIINKTQQLDAIAKFNGLLIQEDDWLKALNLCLEDFGEVTNADRVYFFKNNAIEEIGPVTTMKIEWVQDGIKPQIDNPVHHQLPFDEISSFIETLKENKIYNYRVDDIPDKEFAQFLQEQDILSILAFPVFTGDHFRGFIGFDDCTQSRSWNEEEVTFLEAIVINLASAMENELAEKQILYKSKLIETIANVNSRLLELENWQSALNQVIGLIGEAVDADRVYYFENHIDEATGAELTSQKMEWVKDGVKKQIDNPELQNVSFDTFGEYIPLLSQNKIYSSQTHKIKNKEFRERLDRFDILSILIIPVFVNHSYWGFIGFDDCTTGRIWTNEEISFLKTITINLSYAIEAEQADIELRELYQELEVKVKDLATSNAELEQFAFVASHDLQEPLRMITSFLALLERKYGDILDEKGHQYIYYATDGAKRMRNIILDLLDYSRVGRVEEEKTEIDLNEIVNGVLSLNKKLIEEKNAQITRKDLPVIIAVKNQMQQIFQNLIHNALNYQKEDQTPKIKISCKELNNEWKFSIKDNGIGIHPDYTDKIFNIFQRLHTNEEYSGTGIGLAICKKIIEENKGTIGVESEEGKGSTFYFTIPKHNSKHGSL